MYLAATSAPTFPTAATTTSTLFGGQAQQNAASGGLFGTANKSLFGGAATSQPSIGGGLFGQQQPGTAFGATSTAAGGLFGQQQKPTVFSIIGVLVLVLSYLIKAFGQQQPTTGNIFGGTAPAVSALKLLFYF